MDEKMDEITDPKEDEKGLEVISFEENNVILFKVESIVCKSLVNQKFKQSLEKSTKSLKTVIKFEIKENNYLITICDQNRDKVIESKMKLNQLIHSVRRQRPFTHLITVPFNSGPIRDEYIVFRDKVLTEAKERTLAIEETLFQKPSKLHLTFCVLVLLNQNEVSLAKRVLQKSCQQFVRPLLEDKPLNVSIEGLDVMKGHPNRAHVVYAQIKDESNRLQSIADRVVEQFVESGLLEDSDKNKVKLHLTFMNSLFRQRIETKNSDSNTKPKKRIKRESFNAKEIIDSYKSYKFCDSFVESIQLNDIKTRTEDGFYGIVDSFDLSEQ